MRANRASNVRRLLQCFTTKAAMCREGGAVNPSQIEQMFRARSDPTYRPPGNALVRKMEKGLGLPEFSMDEPGGIEHHLPAMIGRLRARGAPVKSPPGLDQVPDSSVATAARGAPTTTALHQATVEALQAALAAGRISDVECASYIGKWLAPA